MIKIDWAKISELLRSVISQKTLERLLDYNWDDSDKSSFMFMGCNASGWNFKEWSNFFLDNPFFKGLKLDVIKSEYLIDTYEEFIDNNLEVFEEKFLIGCKCRLQNRDV